MKHFSAGLRHSILHSFGPIKSWHCHKCESSAQRAAAPVGGQALSTCMGTCDEPARASLPGVDSALVEPALHAAHARTTLTLEPHECVAATEGEPELGSRAAQWPQRLAGAQAPSKAGSDGRDGEEEEEECSLLAFVAALDFDLFTQELGRLHAQASPPKGLPASRAHGRWPLTKMQCPMPCMIKRLAGNALHVLRRRFVRTP